MYFQTLSNNDRIFSNPNNYTCLSYLYAERRFKLNPQAQINHFVFTVNHLKKKQPLKELMQWFNLMIIATSTPADTWQPLRIYFDKMKIMNGFFLNNFSFVTNTILCGCCLLFFFLFVGRHIVYVFFYNERISLLSLAEYVFRGWGGRNSPKNKQQCKVGRYLCDHGMIKY